jgi:hypothetical protein
LSGADGILISTKDDKAYLLLDGKKSIVMVQKDAVTRAPASNTKNGIILAMLGFLKAYYSSQKLTLFNPVLSAKMECVEYLIKAEKEE